MSLGLGIWSTIAAVFMSFVGNSINALGLIYQKMGHTSVKRKRSLAQHALLKWTLEKDGHSIGPPELSSFIVSNRVNGAPEHEENLRVQCIEAEKHYFLLEPRWVLGFGA